MLDATNAAADVDGRSTRWDAHKVRRRLDILDAAIAAIEHDGPDVGVKAIAERVALPRPAVYRHFKDRADLDEQIRQRILDSLMAELAPTLQPDGTVIAAIELAVGTYLHWIERHPHLHAFLVAPAHTTAGASRVVAGTKTEIAARAGEIFATALAANGKDTRLAKPTATGLVGFVDATVNRWLADEHRTLTTAQLAEFLTRSIWSVLDGNLRALGVEIAPESPVGEVLGD
ncbi:TetR/AcrR family transcriptional regulator [Amycolatopsis anabasis]|uniref:TetR/AcrR family transcriptional regulator n=1 Tax=Amycolatopsis anabasis TaxID=1840409 RepID=UPI00131B0684|nr:TetR/AcrR family transcriptional regulator [Amycolatopsis anabasis]